MSQERMNMSDLVNVVPNFLADYCKSGAGDGFETNLMGEINNIVNKCGNQLSKVESVVLAEDPSILNFPTLNMGIFPLITQLCKIINTSCFKTDSDLFMNCCVVNWYPDNVSRSQPHADDEAYMDKHAPVCTLSLGGTREFHLFQHMLLRNAKPAYTELLNHGSLCIMDAKSNVFGKHMVGKGPSRWSLSYRRVVKCNPNKRDWPYMSGNIECPSPTKASSPLKSPTFPKPAIDPSGTTAFLPGKTSSPKAPSIQKLPLSPTRSQGETPQSEQDHYHDQVSLESLNKILPLLDLMTSKKLLVQLNNHIRELEQSPASTVTEAVVDELVEYIPSISSLQGNISILASSNDLINLVEGELNGLTCSSTDPGGVEREWLTFCNPKDVPFLRCKEITKYPAIFDTMRLINSNYNLELNSCLISYYPDGNAATRRHSDNAAYLSETSPICNLSIGDLRDLEFFDKSRHSPALKSFTLEQGSLLIMKPTTQTLLEHKLKPATTSTTCKPRWCVSYRKVEPLSTLTPNPNCAAKSHLPPSSKNVTIILGTSITTGLKPAKLCGNPSRPSNSNNEVLNLSVRGYKIEDISRTVDKLYTGELENHRGTEHLCPTNIIISVGTNDIRWKRRGVANLYTPVSKLLNKVKMLYPNTNIYVQGSLPMGIEHRNTVSNCLEYNKLLQRCCRESLCYYMDVFDEFLDRRGHLPEKSIYGDAVHLNNVGLGRLARVYIKIVRNIFNPNIRL